MKSLDNLYNFLMVFGKNAFKDSFYTVATKEYFCGC